jgi:hypothetical protein
VLLLVMMMARTRAFRGGFTERLGAEVVVSGGGFKERRRGVFFANASPPTATVAMAAAAAAAVVVVVAVMAPGAGVRRVSSVRVRVHVRAVIGVFAVRFFAVFVVVVVVVVNFDFTFAAAGVFIVFSVAFFFFFVVARFRLPQLETAASSTTSKRRPSHRNDSFARRRCTSARSPLPPPPPLVAAGAKSMRTCAVACAGTVMSMMSSPSSPTTRKPLSCSASTLRTDNVDSLPAGLSINTICLLFAFVPVLIATVPKSRTGMGANFLSTSRFSATVSMVELMCGGAAFSSFIGFLFVGRRSSPLRIFPTSRLLQPVNV